MSCTDKFNTTRKLRPGEREKKRDGERKREKERKRKWTEWRVGSFTFAFGSVDILLQLSNRVAPLAMPRQWQQRHFMY
jgi:hypothetical protein